MKAVENPVHMRTISLLMIAFFEKFSQISQIFQSNSLSASVQRKQVIEEKPYVLPRLSGD